MIINIGLWTDPMFGAFGDTLRETWSNPFIDTFLTFGGEPIPGLPHWPVFETLVGAIVLVGAVYYLVAQRGREDRIDADVATGEAMIA